MSKSNHPLGPIDTSTPATRTLGGLWDAWGARGKTLLDAYIDPNISTPELGAHAVAQTVGGMLDVAGTAPAFVADAVVPGRAGEQLIQRLAQTEAGQFVLSQWDSLDQTTKTRLKSGAVGAEVVAGSLGFRGAFNALGRNAWSLVPDFYSGNFLAQMAGVLNSFGKHGTGAAVRQAVTPMGQALLREGVPQGLVDEVTGLSQALRLYDVVLDKKKKGLKLNKDEADAWKIIHDEAGRVTHTSPEGKNLWNQVRQSFAAAGKKQPASKGNIRSFIEGALMTRLHMLKQQGKDTGLLEVLMEHPYASNVAPLSSPSVKQSLGDVPDVVADRLLNHITRKHGLKDDAIVITRGDRSGDINISNEAWGQDGTVHGRLYRGFRNEEGSNGKVQQGQLAKAGIDRFNSVEEAREFIAASNLSASDQAKYIALQRKDTLTKREQNTLHRLYKALEDRGRVRVSEPDADGFIYFQDAHHSAAKELGGVNVMTALNPTSGEAYGFLTDASDLFHVVGPGNKQLVTVAAPIRWNVYNPKRKGGGIRTTAEPKTTPEQAIATAQARTGVEPGPRLPGNTAGSGLLTSYASDVLQQYRPKPELRDYISATGNVAKLGAAGGLLAAHNNNRNE